MFECNKIARGVHALVKSARKHADVPLQKIYAMQEIFLQRNSGLYTKEERNRLRYYLKAVAYKFHLANLSLEQLWALSEDKRQELFFALENSLDRLDVSDDELLAISFAFEGFLFQATSFLDFYMLYICLLLKSGHQGSISKKRFFKALAKVSDPFLAGKAQRVSTYFANHVFAETTGEWLVPHNWGTLLRSLRDKIAHRDRIRPSFESDETLVGEVLLNWPTLQSITYDRFCQYMQNGMFALFTDVAPLLYDLEWRSGPYRRGMWDEEA
ncbi:hypothetical protein D6817_02070 [Candidatus Pacearchaeota archaeon]|nr:MAG: hypothetical protein D6817_02070 [Candidatus Pacearchaeota archaeon]